MEVKLLDLLVWRWWYFIFITKAFSDLRKWFHSMKQTELEILCEDWAVQKRFLLLSRQHHRRMYIRLKANTVLPKEEIFKCSGVCWLGLRMLNRVTLTGYMVYFYAGDYEWWPRQDLQSLIPNFYFCRQFWTGCPHEENCRVNYIRWLLDIFELELIFLPTKSVWTHQKLLWFSLAL